MIKLDIRADIREVSRGLDALAKKQIPFATRLALNASARQAKVDLQAKMRSVFDEPVPFTLNSVAIRPAGRDRLTAEVGFRDFAPKGVPAGRYLRPEVEGGARVAKSTERRLRAAGIVPGNGFLVPGPGAQIDRHGNVRTGQIVKMLSSLQALGGSGFNGNANSRRRSRGSRRGQEYFAIIPGQKQGLGGRGGGLKPGIYQRFRFGFGQAVKPVFLITEATPTYAARFQFFAVATQSMKASFPREMRAALAKAIRTAR
ncbi:hypothetical protein [Roseomonas chloroacetimidivorans]|uniref:hypothetical protein n=1 Tax=Roseomonas chloroacetimidivorans TaxID=1766656 RepID=UPI003C71FEBB